jgi:hypothetical protein
MPTHHNIINKQRVKIGEERREKRRTDTSDAVHQHPSAKFQFTLDERNGGREMG